jgi:hypothetical protein
MGTVEKSLDVLDKRPDTEAGEACREENEGYLGHSSMVKMPPLNVLRRTTTVSYFSMCMWV